MNKLTTTGPSFVMGYWRPWKENSNAFDSFLDYSKDLGLANYTASAVGTYIQEAASHQVDAINNLAHEIGYGMDVLSSQLEDVSGELRFLNRNMDIQIEQQKLSNLLLQDIAELLRVPDSEKERQLSIEMGVKFLVNAAKDPDLYDDALEELHKAEELRKQDYFVLHRLGTIYLYTEKHMNPEKALNYFLLAAKYASVESDPMAMRLANVMTQSFDTVNSSDSTESIQHLAGDSYEKAAFACYVLGRFAEAEKNQQKALKLNPTPENKFLLAKYAVRSGNIDAGVKYLSEAIDESPELMGGVFKELDLANEKTILEMVKKKNDDVDSEIDIIDLKDDKNIYLMDIEDIESKISNLKKIISEFKNKPYHERVKKVDYNDDYKKLLHRLEVRINIFYEKLSNIINEIKKNQNYFKNYNTLLSQLESVSNKQQLVTRDDYKKLLREVTATIDVANAIEENIILLTNRGTTYDIELIEDLNSIKDLPISEREAALRHINSKIFEKKEYKSEIVNEKNISPEKKLAEQINKPEQKKKAEEEGWLIVKIIIGLLIAILLWVIF